MADQFLAGITHPPTWIRKYIVHQLAQRRNTLAPVIRENLHLSLVSMDNLRQTQYRSRIRLCVVPPDGGVLDPWTHNRLLQAVSTHARTRILHAQHDHRSKGTSARRGLLNWLDEHGISEREMADGQIPFLAFDEAPPSEATGPRLAATLYTKPHVTKWLFTLLHGESVAWSTTARQLETAILAALRLPLVLHASRSSWPETTLPFWMCHDPAGDLRVPLHNHICQYLEQGFNTFLMRQVDLMHYGLGIGKRQAVQNVREMLCITEADLPLDSMVRMLHRLEQRAQRPVHRGRPARQSTGLALRVPGMA